MKNASSPSAICRRIICSIRSLVVECCAICSGRRRGYRPTACRDADEANGARGDLPPSEHVETSDGAQDLSVPLRKLAVTRPNQIWATDITYIPMARGFVASSIWSPSSLGSPGGCWLNGCRVLHRGAGGRACPLWQARHHQQRPRLTSCQFRLHRHPAPRRDSNKHGWQRVLARNVFVERLWRSVKYEEVYLNAYASVPEARAGIGRYLAFYNRVRPHSALGAKTPGQVHFNQPLLAAA